MMGARDPAHNGQSIMLVRLSHVWSVIDAVHLLGMSTHTCVALSDAILGTPGTSLCPRNETWALWPLAYGGFQNLESMMWTCGH